MGASTHLPVVDVSPWIERVRRGLDAASEPPGAAVAVASEIDRACRSSGFFAVAGHGVPAAALDALDDAARRTFALPLAARQAIAMPVAGAAWRGWFPLGGELTSGRPDLKEGLYFGLEQAPDHPRVAAGAPLHGANLWPESVPELRPAVLGWLDALRPVADAVLRAISVGLGLEERWFERDVTADPTVLFRVFRYPPDPDVEASDGWGVGEHTDYGLLTLLAQDGTPGLEVRTADGMWISAPASRELLIVNLGDMLERATAGRYRSTPHRVRNRTGADRLSFPYFFDPSWDATVPVLPIGDGPAGASPLRWDGSDPVVFDGTYGDYLTAKIARVFPHLLPTPPKSV